MYLLGGGTLLFEVSGKYANTTRSHNLPERSQAFLK